MRVETAELIWDLWINTLISTVLLCSVLFHQKTQEELEMIKSSLSSIEDRLKTTSGNADQDTAD